MVGGRVGFYELEKSDFVLFKPRFYLKQSSYFTIIVGYKLSVHWKTKKRKLNFFGHMYPTKLNEHLIFQPSSRWNVVKVIFQHSASALEIYIREGGLSAQCKRWKKCTIFFSISLLKFDWKFWILEFDRSGCYILLGRKPEVFH